MILHGLLGRGSLHDLMSGTDRKCRVGDDRIIADVQHRAIRIVIVRIGHCRRQVYNR